VVTPSVGGTSLGSHRLTRDRPGGLFKGKFGLCAAGTDDADWVNAFGSVKHGRQEIITYLRGLFADANFNAGTLKAAPQSSIRVLTNEVVLVSVHLLIEGQKLLDGGVIDERDNHSLHVLQRQNDGTWPVVSEMYMDANRDQSYAGHS
jgi:uncharacterized protein (TIGR02246 family)